MFLLPLDLSHGQNLHCPAHVKALGKFINKGRGCANMMICCLSHKSIACNGVIFLSNRGCSEKHVFKHHGVLRSAVQYGKNDRKCKIWMGRTEINSTNCQFYHKCIFRFVLIYRHRWQAWWTNKNVQQMCKIRSKHWRTEIQSKMHLLGPPQTDIVFMNHVEIEVHREDASCGLTWAGNST